MGLSGCFEGALAVEWLGQSGFVFRFPGRPVVCVDPYLSYAAPEGGTRERLTPPPVSPVDLGADVILTTHDHTDHFDEHTLRPAADGSPTVFAGPSSCREHWLRMGLPEERFLVLDKGKELEVAGARLLAVHAEHASGEHRDAIGFLINAGGYSVYHTGDSEYVADLVREVAGMRPYLMVVPINGRKGNMDAGQAARLTHEVRPRAVIPVHYGMFESNTADPQKFLDACRESAPGVRVLIPRVGGRLWLTSEDT